MKRKNKKKDKLPNKKNNMSEEQFCSDIKKNIVVPANVIKSVCKHCGFQPMIKVDDEYECEMCGNTQR